MQLITPTNWHLVKCKSLSRHNEMNSNANIYTHNHFMALFPGPPRSAGARRNLLLGFMVQGKITEADTLTIRLGTTPSRLISNSPPSSPHFYAGCPSCRNPPIYPGLGQAPNMLACIPSGLVHTQWRARSLPTFNQLFSSP